MLSPNLSFLGHSTKCREFGISRKNFKNRTGFHQVRFHCLASLSGKIGNYRGWLASREKSGIIGIPIFPDFYRELPTREKSGMIGSEFWRSILAIIDHVFAPAEHCRSVTSPIGNRGAVSSPQKHSCHLATLIIASSFGSCPRPCHPLMLFWDYTFHH